MTLAPYCSGMAGRSGLSGAGGEHARAIFDMLAPWLEETTAATIRANAPTGDLKQTESIAKAATLLAKAVLTNSALSPAVETVGGGMGGEDEGDGDGWEPMDPETEQRLRDELQSRMDRMVAGLERQDLGAGPAGERVEVEAEGGPPSARPPVAASDGLENLGVVRGPWGGEDIRRFTLDH